MKHILIVDDVTTNLKCAVEVLKDSYEVTTAKSGSQALDLLKERVPDLILLDVDMPGMSGYEVMERLNQEDTFKDIPVVFLTAGADKESEIKGLKMGAMDIIRKPFEPEIMRGRIDKILKMTGRRKELSDIAQKDELTDLLNKRYMEVLLNQIETREKGGYFLLLDLDNLKLINDTFGHVVGNEVLVNFAKVLKEEVGDAGIVCRLGGDEFAVYIPKESALAKYEKEKVKKISCGMIAGIEFEINELLPEACDFKISVSVGIAEKPEDGNSFSELYTLADKALYYVKQNGKRGYHFYHDTQKKSKNTEDERLINLLQLQRLIREEEKESGACQVDHDGFRRICRFVSRCMERKSQDTQMVLFTIKNALENTSDYIERKKGIDGLEQAVSSSLRKGDVAAKCGEMRYVVILPNASFENGNLVAQRIQKKFNKVVDDALLSLTYEMQSVEADRAEIRNL